MAIDLSNHNCPGKGCQCRNTATVYYWATSHPMEEGSRPGRVESSSDVPVGSELERSSTPSPSVTGAGGTYGAVTGGNGRSPLPCPACDLPTWDGIHATGHRACGMHEVPGV